MNAAPRPSVVGTPGPNIVTRVHGWRHSNFERFGDDLAASLTACRVTPVSVAGRMDDHLGWVTAIILLTTINTGGGSQVGGDVEAGNNVAMRDIIYADQYTWRSHVDQRMRDQRSDIMELRRSQNYQWIALGLMAVIFLFAVTVASGVIVRQFDHLSLQIEHRFDLIDRKIEQGRIP